MALAPYRVITPPLREPLSLEEAKGHVRVDIQEDDILISNLIVAARELVESETSRKLIDTVVRFTFDQFPGGANCGCGSAWDGFIPSSARGADRIEFPLCPVTAVSAFSYVDENGVTQTLTGYVFKSPAVDSSWVEPTWGNDWPAVRDQTGAITITATVGHGPNPGDVPRIARQAMLLLVGAWYEHREELLMGVAPYALPAPVAAQHLMQQLKWKLS